jgi:CBS domain-containing protein
MTMRHDPIDPGRCSCDERPVFPRRPLLVADRMTRAVITIGWAERVADAARVMEERGIRHLPVVEADGRLIGIVTEGDIRQVLASEGLRDAEAAPATLIVGKVMSLEPTAIAPDSALAAAVALMHERKLSALPVVERDQVVGILTESDILRQFAETIGCE